MALRIPDPKHCFPEIRLFSEGKQSLGGNSLALCSLHGGSRRGGRLKRISMSIIFMFLLKILLNLVLNLILSFF